MLGKWTANGRLGDGLERVHKQLSPLDVKGLEPGTGKGVSAVSAGGGHTCAVVQGAVVQGGMKCWGSLDGTGALGLIEVITSFENITTPRDVQGLDK